MNFNQVYMCSLFFCAWKELLISNDKGFIVQAFPVVCRKFLLYWWNDTDSEQKKKCKNQILILENNSLWLVIKIASKYFDGTAMKTRTSSICTVSYFFLARRDLCNVFRPFVSFFTHVSGSTHHNFLQLCYLGLLLCWHHAGNHQEDCLADADYHENICRWILECSWEHLHWTGTVLW